MKTFTDDELLVIQPIVTNPGTIDEFGNVFDRHLENPFKNKDETLASRWSDLHWNDDGQSQSIEVDPFAALRDALNPQKLWSEVLDSEGNVAGAIPIVPVVPPNSDAQRAAEAAWQERAESMHKQQDVLGAVPAPKPLEPGIRKRAGIVRGD